MTTQERLPKIKRSFVRDEAYKRLRDWIIEGTLSPGVVIRDLDLAEQMGVSRTPIREALLKLEDEGFVITKPNRSTMVSEINLAEAKSLYSIVWTLEKLALEQGINHIKDKQINEMIVINENLKRAIMDRNPLKSNAYDTDFHGVIINSSHNTELSTILNRVKQKLKRIEIFYFNQFNDLLTSYDEHQEIILSIKLRKKDHASSAIENNWKQGLLNINNIIKK
ncbi:GntR family transcriptional regulator [Sporolactobacillus laevolacticus]|uniref:Transcriptional regulator n=1 Tax=Sporolactobacillus laevolacticus DSM 442 TaxID=1395513 RepID=V6ITT8_9BACL|nr:GntR family transcriptional regulator [Sporolactobacillus laevolacticus]EST10237.1 transcriptional regulator [Sporolactobacillus laevolacticus DSM 442]